MKHRHSAIHGFLALIAVTFAATASAVTLNVDFSAGDDLARTLAAARPGDVVLVQGTSRTNVVIPPEVQGITIDGQGKATINASDARQPAIQVLGREIIIKRLNVSGGQFGIAVNRGGTAIIDQNTIREASHSGIEVSQNAFAKIVNNTIERNRLCGILVLGSASAHIGVLSTGDKVASPNLIQNNGQDGIWVARASAARVVGNTLSANKRNGLSIEQASHADVAGNVISGNGRHGILLSSNSVASLADTVMRTFEQANSSAVPNEQFGVRCEAASYMDGPLGGLAGRAGAKDVSDASCTDRSTRP